MPRNVAVLPESNSHEKPTLWITEGGRYPVAGSCDVLDLPQHGEDSPGGASRAGRVGPGRWLQPTRPTVSETSPEEVIGEAASRAAPFHLLLAVPALQSLLFTRPALIARAFGEGADPYGHIADIGRLIPREAYKRLDPTQSEESTFLKLFQALDDDDIAALRQESPVRELIAFVTEVGSPVASASPVP